MPVDGPQRCTSTNYHRNFRQTRVADVLLLERKAWAAGRGHGLDSRNGGSNGAGNGRNFVLHLDELSSLLWKPQRRELCNFG